MRFMMLIKGNYNYEAGMPPEPRLVAAVTQFIEEAANAGVLVATEGLRPSADGAVVRLAHGKLTVTDGPFAEAREVIGGYAVLRLDSKQDAIEAAKRFLKLHEEVLGRSFEGAVRNPPNLTISRLRQFGRGRRNRSCHAIADPLGDRPCDSC